jgi:hypothetical protein
VGRPRPPEDLTIPPLPAVGPTRPTTPKTTP